MNIDSRKIVQLVSREKLILALCTDGTVWKLERNIKIGFAPNAYNWAQLPGVPEK